MSFKEALKSFEKAKKRIKLLKILKIIAIIIVLSFIIPILVCAKDDFLVCFFSNIAIIIISFLISILFDGYLYDTNHIIVKCQECLEKEIYSFITNDISNRHFKSTFKNCIVKMNFNDYSFKISFKYDNYDMVQKRVKFITSDLQNFLEKYGSNMHVITNNKKINEITIK